MTETTYIDPDFRLVSGRRTVDGVLFKSYRTGISQYCQISEDGQVKTDVSHRLTSFHTYVVGHGVIKSRTGYAKKFRTQTNAALAGLKLHRKLTGASK